MDERSGAGTTESEAGRWSRRRAVGGRRVRRWSVAAAALVAVTVLGSVAGGSTRAPVGPTTSGTRATLEPLAPFRVLDTRNGTGAPTGKVGSGQTIEVTVTGGPVPTDASAVVLNLTVAGASAASHLRAHPAGTVRPNASVLNFGAGGELANAVTVKVGTGGRIALYNHTGQVHVIADVLGYYRSHDHDDRYPTEAALDQRFAASDYVGSAQIVDGSVGAEDIGLGAITGKHLTESAVTGGNIRDGSIGLADVGTLALQTRLTVAALAVPAGQCRTLRAFELGAPYDGAFVLPRVVGAASGSLAELTLLPSPTHRGVFQLLGCNGSAVQKTVSADVTVELRALR